MFGLRQALVFTTLIASSFVSAAPQQPDHDDSIVNWDRLNTILDQIDNNVLHSVLHNLSPKFRDGVFSKDRAAIEHVHSENPVMASKLVYIAKRATNGTAAVVPAATSSSAEKSSSSSAKGSSSTSIAAVAATVSDAVASQITASTVPAATTIEIAPSTKAGETAISTIPSSVIYSTHDGSTVAVSTVPGEVVFSTTGGGVVTRTSSAVGVRFTPSTSTHTYYSTAANGDVTTSTSLVVVNAPVTETAAATGAAGAAQSSSTAGLQNAAPRASPESVVAGIIGSAFLGVVGLFLTL